MTKSSREPLGSCDRYSTKGKKRGKKGGGEITETSAGHMNKLQKKKVGKEKLAVNLVSQTLTNTV